MIDTAMQEAPPTYYVRREMPAVEVEPVVHPVETVQLVESEEPVEPVTSAIEHIVEPEHKLETTASTHQGINKSIVFTTKNRYGYVRLLADSFKLLKAYEHAHIHIFDDGSTDFSIQDLKDWFPYAQVLESDHRHPDMSIRHSFEWFVNESNDEILITIDSDTMLHPNWNNFIDTHIDKSGVLSLYHSAAKYHKSVNCDQTTCEKKSTGSMGMVMTRRIVKDMLLNMHNAKHKAAAFDWGFVDYFKKKGIKIIVPKNSLALHYGMYGAHGSGNHVEVANTFDFTPFPSNIVQRAKAFLDNMEPEIASIYILTTGKRDVSNLKKIIPTAKLYKGSIGYDESCKSILKEIGVKFQDHFWKKNRNYLKEGKLGHWCSNLRFAKDCNDICILIEDDVLLNTHEVKYIYKTIKEDWTTPVLRLGKSGDMINIWNGLMKERIFDAVRSGIDNPMDIFFANHHLYTSRKGIGTLSDPTNDNLSSIIRSMDNKINLKELNWNILGQYNTYTVNISGRNIQYYIPHIMKPSDIVIGILSFDKEKRMIMRKLYAGENFYFAVARKNGTFDFEEFNTYNDMVFIDMEEAYFGDNSILPYKTQILIHMFNTHIDNFNYVLKLDDDSYVKIDNLRAELKKQHYDYWGRVWINARPNRDRKNKWFVSSDVYPGDKYPNYCSGAGYVLSKKLISCMDTKLATHVFMPREDVATGILAKKCGAVPHNSNQVQAVGPYKTDDFIIRHYVDISKVSSKASHSSQINICLYGNPVGRTANKLVSILHALPVDGTLTLDNRWSTIYEKWLEPNDKVILYSKKECTEKISAWDAFYKFKGGKEGTLPLYRHKRPDVKLSLKLDTIKHAESILSTFEGPVATVHGRWLEGQCLDRANVLNNHCTAKNRKWTAPCTYTEKFVRQHTNIQNILYCSDDQKPEYRKTFKNVDQHGFDIQLAIMSISDYHFGNPQSTIDYVLTYMREKNTMYPEECFNEAPA